MNYVDTRFSTLIKAAVLLLLLLGGSKVINSVASSTPLPESIVLATNNHPLEEPKPENSSEGVILEITDPQSPRTDDGQRAVYTIPIQFYPEHDICAEAWRVDVNVIPIWLQTPVFVEQLHTEIAYNLLAGKLISNGIVDASRCVNGGLFSNGSANACGLEIAMPAVIAWQNQFDEAILLAARENRIPAVLLKRMFAKETQFWPGTSWLQLEYGLGQATSFGLDALFQYYPSYFAAVCPQIFTSDACAKSYSALSPTDQSLLRGYMATVYLNSDCETCEAGIDIAKVTSTIDVFAKLLVANCHQVNQIIVNYTEKPGGEFSTYEDLWRFTLANYNAGSGCINDSVKILVEEEKELNWINVANKLIGLGNTCAGSIDYAFEISH